MEDSNEFDEFLFHSIKSYDTLQMFNLENVPQHLLQLQDTSVCVVSQRIKGNNSELLRLQLPKKLFLPSDEEGRCKENDFKILSGAYTASVVHSACKMACGNKIVTSELNIKGLNLYDLCTESIGAKVQQENIDVIPWTNPNIAAINSTNLLLCSKTVFDSLLLVDIEVQKLSQEIKHDWLETQEHQNYAECKNNILCERLSDNVVAVLNSDLGKLALHDLRTDKSILNTYGPDEQNNLENWTISRHDSSDIDFNYFGILSNRNNFFIFDSRKACKLFEKVENEFFIPNAHQIKLKFNKQDDQFSISGYDSNVNVFCFNDNGFRHLFKHIGHSPGNCENATVIDHIWLNVGQKELVLSACDNKTLNCWEFNKNIC